MGVRHPPKESLWTTFNVQRSMFNVRCSPMESLRTTSNVQSSKFEVRCSTFIAQAKKGPVMHHFTVGCPQWEVSPVGQTTPQTCVLCVILSTISPLGVPSGRCPQWDWALSHGFFGSKALNAGFASTQANTSGDIPHSCQGVQLLLDDYLIGESENVIRQVNQPKREPNLPNPLITGGEDRCFQPYFTVLQDPQTRRFRIWLGSTSLTIKMAAGATTREQTGRISDIWSLLTVFTGYGHIAYCP